MPQDGNARQPEAAPGAGGRRTVEDVVEDLGFGRSQLCANVLVNGAWLADGSEALAISALTRPLTAEWELSSTQQGSLSAVVYLGTLVGNIASGWLGDARGRRSPILLCYPIIVVFSLLSGCSQHVWQLLCFRFFVGFGFGVGQPAAVALLVEVSPVRWRMLNQGLAQVAFALGELFCCLLLWLDDPSMRNLHWRMLLVAGAIPAAAFWLLSWRFLAESPAHLALRDPAEATKVLDDMRRANGREEASIEFVAKPPLQELPVLQQLRRAFRGRLLWRTLLLCFICFSYNLTVYGAFFALPQLLPNMNVGMSPAAVLAVGALVEIPFDLLGVLLGGLVSRKAALGASFVFVAASLALFSSASAPGEGADAPFALRVGYYGLKGFPQVSSLILYVYASELYPVAVRATGTATVMGFGRLGAISSSLVYEWLLEGTGKPATFFVVAAWLTALSAIAILPLPETSPGGRKAFDLEDEEEEIPLAAGRDTKDV